MTEQKEFRPVSLVVPGFATLLLEAALWFLAQPETDGGPGGLSLSGILGFAFLLFSLLVSLISLAERRTAGALVAGLALVAVLAFLELLIWPAHPELLEVPRAPENGLHASLGAWLVLLLAALAALLGAWKSRAVQASLLAALVIACLHIILFEAFVARSQSFVTEVALNGGELLFLLATTAALSLLPWPGRSLLALPAIALGLALLALNGVYSETHWPGGYLIPGLPFGSRSGAGIAGETEWHLHLLLLATALSITVLRLAWRWWRRKGAGEA